MRFSHSWHALPGYPLPRFITTTDLAATVSPSADFPGETGYTAYLAPTISGWGEDGFSSCLACPCHRADPTTPAEGCASTVSLRHTLLPSLHHRELGLRG